MSSNDGFLGLSGVQGSFNAMGDNFSISLSVISRNQIAYVEFLFFHVSPIPNREKN